MQTIATELPKEQARVREILGYYKEIGRAGNFGAFFIERSLQKADQAVMSDDVIEMLKAYEDLKTIKD